MVPQEAPRHVCSQGERPPEARVGKRRVRKAATPSAQRELYMEEKGSPEKLRSNLSSHWKTLVRIGACTIRIRKIWWNDPQAAQTAAATWLRGGHCHARPSGPGLQHRSGLGWPGSKPLGLHMQQGGTPLLCCSIARSLA